MSTTSQRIQEGMNLRGYKQIDLVEKTGISKGALSSYISGRYVPKQNNIYLIAKALDVNEAWLMGANVPMERVSERVSEKPSATITLYNVHCETQPEAELVLTCRDLNDVNKKKVSSYTRTLLSTQQMEDEVYEVAAAASIIMWCILSLGLQWWNSSDDSDREISVGSDFLQRYLHVNIIFEKRITMKRGSV